MNTAVTSISLIAAAITPAHRKRSFNATRNSLIAMGLLSLIGCNDHSGGGASDTGPVSSGLVPGAQLSQSGTTTLEQYSSTSSSGASVSQSPHYTLMNQGASR